MASDFNTTVLYVKEQIAMRDRRKNWCPIGKLPNELLLLIASKLDCHTRIRDLTNLSLVSRKWNQIAREQLLTEPTFSLLRIDKYLWHLAQYDNIPFISKIKRLEIKSSHHGRHKNPDGELATVSNLFGLRLGSVARRLLRKGLSVFNVSEYPISTCPTQTQSEKAALIKDCYGLIQEHAGSFDKRLRWMAALDNDVWQAFLGVLLIILPNLKELYAGASWLMDFPLFRDILTPEVTRTFPARWNHPFLIDVLHSLYPKLEVLEFPMHLQGLSFDFRARALFDFRPFKKLRSLSLPMDAIYYCHNEALPHADPSSFLPESLEFLRVGHCTEATAGFMTAICGKKKRGNFSKLRRLELYYWYAAHLIIKLAEQEEQLNPIESIKRMCIAEGLQLYMYFPIYRNHTADFGETPWMLAKEGRLLQVERGRYGDDIKPYLGDHCREVIIDGKGLDEDGDSFMLGV